MSNSLSTWLRLLLPSAGDLNWDDEIVGNLRTIDTIFGTLIASSGYKGYWRTSTAYIANNLVIEPGTGAVYKTLISHTSRTSGTFAQDLAANPTYWAMQTYSFASLPVLNHESTQAASHNLRTTLVEDVPNIFIGSGLGSSSAAALSITLDSSVGAARTCAFNAKDLSSTFASTGTLVPVSITSPTPNILANSFVGAVLGAASGTIRPTWVSLASVMLNTGPQIVRTVAKVVTAAEVTQLRLSFSNILTGGELHHYTLRV